MSTPDDGPAVEVEEEDPFDTAAAAAPVLPDEDDADLVDDDRDAPTEAGGPPAPAGDRQDET